MKGTSESLQGLTVFRFAHIWRSASAGGVEAYLMNLNRRLLERNRIRVLQMYLTKPGVSARVEIETVGHGEIVWIPSLITNGGELERTRTQVYWNKVRRRITRNIGICHDMLLSALDRYLPNLAVFHWLNVDSKIVVNYLIEKQVPYVIVNHFHNDRLKSGSIRRQIAGALAIGGVSGIDVPEFVRDRFTNLSDGIDTDFFQLERAISMERVDSRHLVLLPSRVTENKGHLDMIRALGWLRHRGVPATLVCAGRVESAGLVKKLKKTMQKEGVEGNIIFTGELSAVDLRNWYGASDVVAYTSYSEGLGRVLLEAQAMKRPVVAYNVGGVPEAVLQGEGGYLVEKGGYEELAGRLKELLEDKGKRDEMGERGKAFVSERFSLDALVVRHERFYAAALQQLGR